MLSKRLIVLAGLLVLTGCHCGSTYQDSSYGYQDSSYGYGANDYGADLTASTLPPTEKSSADRLPLLSAPRNYYRDSGDNPVVKVLAGTVIGVPVGVAQELWQIGYGQ